MCFFSKRGWGGQVSIFQTCKASLELLVSHSSAWTKEGRNFYTYIWGITIVIAKRGCRDKKQYNTDSTGTSNKVLLPVLWITDSPVFGYLQYYRVREMSLEMLLRSVLVAVLYSVRKSIFPFGFSWELSLSFRYKRAQAPKEAWKISGNCVSPHKKMPQPSSSWPISNPIKGSLQHLLSLDTVPTVWTVWIIVTICLHCW